MNCPKCNQELSGPLITATYGKGKLMTKVPEVWDCSTKGCDTLIIRSDRLTVIVLPKGD